MVDKDCFRSDRMLHSCFTIDKLLGNVKPHSPRRERFVRIQPSFVATFRRFYRSTIFNRSSDITKPDLLRVSSAPTQVDAFCEHTRDMTTAYGKERGNPFAPMSDEITAALDKWYAEVSVPMDHNSTASI